MRFIRYRDIPWWMPTSIQLDTRSREEVKAELSHKIFSQIKDGDGPSAVKGEFQLHEELRQWEVIEQKKAKTQAVFNRHYGQTEVNYAEVQEIWKEELSPESKFHAKKEITSMARRIIPMGVATGGVWTLNMRALRHVLAMRASDAAEEEILHVWTRIGKEMVEGEPSLMGDFTMSPEGYWTPKYAKV